jgi:hypothetical protein
MGAAQAGRTDWLNATCPLKWFADATLIPNVAFAPGVTLRVVGAALNEKVPVFVTYRFTVLGWQMPPPHMTRSTS